jgi:hypothetical protein
VRPEHLYAGTHANNTADMVARQRCATGRRSGVYTHPESWHRRLTRVQVAEIKARPATRGRALAREFGVSEQTICDIRKGRIWADVPAAETLVLERLPNGEHAWLRRELDAARCQATNCQATVNLRRGLQAAATFAGGKALSTEVSTRDVLKVAAAFERWLLGQER